MPRPSPMKPSKKTNFTSSRGICLCWILSYLFNSQLTVVLTCKLLEGQRALTQWETCSCRAAFYDLRLLQAQLLQLSTANGADRNWLYDFRFFLKFSRIVQKNLCIVASRFWGMIDPLLVAKSPGRLWVLCHLSCLLRNNSPGTWRADRILSPLAGMFRYFFY
jgi:hypothetical protein